LKIFIKILMIVALLFCANSPQAKPQADDFKEERAEHFLIYYIEGVSRGQVSEIKKLAEKYYRLITQEFNLIRDKLWSWDNRAKIYIVKERQQYQDRFNCQSWSEACVDYQNKVIYTYSGQIDFSRILAHELTHIIFREYARNERFPLWLDEGVATYIEDKYAGGHYRRYLGNIREKISNATCIPISEMMKVSGEKLAAAPKDYVMLFYAQSYSVVNFIIDKYGRHNFSRFLAQVRQGASIEEALAKIYFDFRDLQKMETLWEKFYL
jgi:hypothetical protein